MDAKTVKEKLDVYPIFDNFIREHGFTSYLRDYDIAFDIPAFAPRKNKAYVYGRYRYRFTHCVDAQITIIHSENLLRMSWSDEFIDYDVWKQADEPEGYVWFQGFTTAYPGLEYVENSERARDWTERLQKKIHEVTIETNCQLICLIFHDLVVSEIARGNPKTDELIPV